MIDIVMAIVGVVFLGVVFLGLGAYVFFQRNNQQEEETEKSPQNNNLLVGAYIACGFFLILGSLAKFTLAYAIGMLISAGGSLMIARQSKEK